MALVLRERFGVVLPDYADETPEDPQDRPGMARAILAGADDVWSRIAHRPSLRDPLEWRGREQPGDVVLMRRQIWPCHVGLVVAPNVMIHTEETVNVAAAEIRRGREANTVISVYRHRDLT